MDLIELEEIERKIQTASSDADRLILAGEFGQKLLAKNNQLHRTIEEQEFLLKDKNIEIEHLKKECKVLREINDSRLMLYDEIEASIHKVESDKAILGSEVLKKQEEIKFLLSRIDTLEDDINALTFKLKETEMKMQAQQCKNDQLLHKIEELEFISSIDHNKISQEDITNKTDIPLLNSDNIISDISSNEDLNNEVLKLLQENQALKKAYSEEKDRCIQLNKELDNAIQENTSLQEQVSRSTSSEGVHSLHDEINNLKEVRQKEMCCCCLRSINRHNYPNSDQISTGTSEDCDDNCVAECEKQTSIAYTTLKEKYKTLIELQQSTKRSHIISNAKGNTYGDEIKETLPVKKELPIKGEDVVQLKPKIASHTYKIPSKTQKKSRKNRNLIRDTIESSIAITLPPHKNGSRNYSKCISKRNNIAVHYNKRCLLSKSEQFQFFHKEKNDFIQKIIDSPLCASKTFSKLKKLDLSYAQVLRNN